MSYFADTKCPKCGKVTQHHLGGYGFYGSDKTTNCSFCGYTYESIPNCLGMIPDRDNPPVLTLQQRLSKFSTEELEEELRRRRS